jgi:hypothetical protein
LIAIHTVCRETARTLADVLARAGFATAWQSEIASTSSVRGAVAGIWDGGQLSEREAEQLSKMCRRMAVDSAPVVVLLDFPRRDCVDRALQLGAAVVLGKPWINEELIETVQVAVKWRRVAQAA